MEIKLQTPRLYMREFTLADAEILYQMHQDPAITKYTGDPIPWDNIKMVENIIAEALIPQYQFGIGRWACHLLENDEFIGWCGLKKVGNEVDLGYRFIQKYWGNGYATEAAQAVLNYGIKNKIPNMIGCADVENIASVKVLQKIGLTFKEYYFEKGEVNQSIKFEWIG
jgi:RimJ/RimL family protein N-acetyltransferase